MVHLTQSHPLDHRGGLLRRKLRSRLVDFADAASPTVPSPPILPTSANTHRATVRALQGDACHAFYKTHTVGSR